jgi:voltage-gated potassium channel
VSTLHTHKYAILLVALLVVTLVKSFSKELLHPVLLGVVMLATMLLVFLVVFQRKTDRGVAFVALVVAAAAFAAANLLTGEDPQSPYRAVTHVASVVLTGFATFVILRNIFAQRVILADDVLGAVCGYLLAAEAWSGIYLLIESSLPGSFVAGPAFGSELHTWYGRIVVLSNLSLGSLTGVGSNAAIAVRPPATILIPLEALFGQFYLAVVVAQLVGARLSQPQK